MLIKLALDLRAPVGQQQHIKKYTTVIHLITQVLLFQFSKVKSSIVVEILRNNLKAELKYPQLCFV